jgi:hypothetical protein
MHRMTSVEKLLRYLEDMQDIDDAELAEAMPWAPPGAVRIAMAKAAGKIPDDPALLDAWALQAAIFCLNIRSDQAEPFTLVQGDPDGEVVTALPVQTS